MFRLRMIGLGGWVDATWMEGIFPQWRPRQTSGRVKKNPVGKEELVLELAVEAVEGESPIHDPRWPDAVTHGPTEPARQGAQNIDWGLPRQNQS